MPPPPAHWPVLKSYNQTHLRRTALPLGGIGTGTISLGGRGDLRDWEIMNQPDKGFTPRAFFALYARRAGGAPVARCLEGPIESCDYEGAMGVTVPKHGLPRFRDCRFDAAYPFGQVHLSDPDVPVKVTLQAFNPLVPADPDRSGIPVAVLRYVVTNTTSRRVTASLCSCVENFLPAVKPHNEPPAVARNRFRRTGAVRGIMLDAPGGDEHARQHGSIAIATTASKASQLTGWPARAWGGDLLTFWDAFGTTGALPMPVAAGHTVPVASLAAEITLPPRATRSVTFLLGWHFPNRYTWTPSNPPDPATDIVGNYYAGQYRDAWDVLAKTAPQLDALEQDTRSFVQSFCSCDLPAEVREAALFNLAHLRSETCFRTADGNFFGFEGCSDKVGCCLGSCTHVWNYEQAVAFLFGDLACRMRRIEFGEATDEAGRMSFRVHLPLDRAQESQHAAADGQMGCILKMYRDWQLSGDDELLNSLWPNVRKALEFCWVPGGWDGDCDGVMEGCQHNTMDVEYYGPNPQMQIWYLGALRAAEEMALYLGEQEFAEQCRDLFEHGRTWTDENLFNGEYYEHRIELPKKGTAPAEGLAAGMGARSRKSPDYQLGKGCLVDQLVGQFLAHVCGLGYLVKPTHVRKTLRSIMKYNYRKSLRGHFNSMRSFALGDEAALLMAHYPGERPAYPFPYFTEVMTGFEYTAAIGMLYEGQTQNGLKCIRNIRNRYDGWKRSPFNEAECGHHYARSMASWAAVNALTGFHYSAVDGRLAFDGRDGTFFWSSGYGWGTVRIRGRRAEVRVLGGSIALRTLVLSGRGETVLPRRVTLKPARERVFSVSKEPATGTRTSG